MLKVFKPLVTVCGMATVILTVGQVQPAQAAGLVPHHAGYTVRLAESRNTAALTSVTGQIGYGLEKVCNGGWLLQQSGTMNMHLSNGDVFPQVLHFSSIEDGSKYRFSVNSDGQLKNSVFGSAQMPADGTQGKAIFTQPRQELFSLPPGTLFPVAHTRFMIDEAKANKLQFQSYIFEGTEVEGAKLLVVFVSPLSDRAKAIMKQVNEVALKRPGWNFRLAYFDPKSQTGEPMYEVEVDLLDNGIAPRWVLDYGGFSVEMSLLKLTTLDKFGC